MNAGAAESQVEPLYVIGIGLPASCRSQLVLAFPRCIFLSPAVLSRKQISHLCDLLGKVVLFLYIPLILEKMWIRASAIFHIRNVKIIGVHPHVNDDIYDHALEAEFAGVLDADADASAYLRAAARVELGELWFPRSYLSRRTREAASAMSPNGLTAREKEVLELLTGDATNQDIADALCVSRETIRWHLRSVYAKLGASDREAVSRMAKNKVLV